MISLVCHKCQRGRLLESDWKDQWDYWRGMFQSLFFYWCQTYYLLVRQFLIRSKYYHLVDWWRWFNQQDVTKELKGKVELWFFNEVQGSVKIMVKIMNW